jgi:hypothetical protein
VRSKRLVAGWFSYARDKMKFEIGNKLVKRPPKKELISQTGDELEGPAGDFVKVAFTVPS